MKNILTLNAISPVINDVFDSTYNVANDVNAPIGIMLRSFKMHDYTLDENTIAIARAGAGTNNIPVEKYAEQRVTPPCKHYGVCGGCKWQILPYNEQIKYKQQRTPIDVRCCLLTYFLYHQTASNFDSLTCYIFSIKS